MSARPRRAGWGLAAWFGALALGCLVAAIINAAAAKWAAVGFAVGLAAFFSWALWILWPPHLRNRDPGLVARDRDRLNRLFHRLRINWAVDPEWRERQQRP